MRKKNVIKLIEKVTENIGAEKKEDEEMPTDLESELESLKTFSKTDKWGILREMVSSLKDKYAKLKEIREELSEKKDELEEKKLESAEAVADGGVTINIKPYEAAVTKSEKQVKAQELVIKLSEKKAKRKFPERFEFL